VVNALYSTHWHHVLPISHAIEDTTSRSMFVSRAQPKREDCDCIAKRGPLPYLIQHPASRRATNQPTNQPICVDSWLRKLPVCVVVGIYRLRQLLSHAAAERGSSIHSVPSFCDRPFCMCLLDTNRFLLRTSRGLGAAAVGRKY
jgi:hypothetical protein